MQPLDPAVLPWFRAKKSDPCTQIWVFYWICTHERRFFWGFRRMYIYSSGDLPVCYEFLVPRPAGFRYVVDIIRIHIIVVFPKAVMHRLHIFKRFIVPLLVLQFLSEREMYSYEIMQEASKSCATAKASGTFKYASLTKSKSIGLKCSKNGSISKVNYQRYPSVMILSGAVH